MPYPSPYGFSHPVTDVLSWLFPRDQEPSDKPIWIDAENPHRTLSLKQLLPWVKRLGLGLFRLGLKEDDVVLVVSRNHIHFPVLWFGVSGFGFIYSGSNPAYGVDGEP